MRTIWKYNLKVVGKNEIVMPGGSNLLHLADQDGDPDTVQLWAEVNTDNPIRRRILWIVGTGFAIPQAVSYFGSVLTADQNEKLVWHVYDGGEDLT